MMRDSAGYLLIGSFTVLAMSLATIAGLGLAVGARPVTKPGQVIQYVDRTHKGDRLDLHTTIDTRPLRPAQKQPAAMPPGCEPVFSTLAASGYANYSGRCVAQLPLHRTMAG